MAELSNADLEQIKTIGNAADFIEMEGNAADQATLRGAVYSALGISGTSKIGVLGLIKQEDYEAVVAAVKIVTPPPDANAAPTQRDLTLAELGTAYYLGRVARVKLGLEGPGSASAKATAPTPPSMISSVATRKVKLNQVLSQIDETEIDIITEAEQIKMYSRYEVLYGRGQRPLPRHEPTVEQLSGLKALTDGGQAPYVDFAVFQPFGARMMKRIKFAGLILNKAGGLMQAELYGPPDLDTWRACFEVFSASAIMLDLLDLGSIQSYRMKIEELYLRYGETKIWALLYQADTRARFEHWGRTKLRLAHEHSEAQAAGKTTLFDPLRPWNTSLQMVAKDDQFWSHELVEPALIVMSHNKQPVLTGDDAKVQGNRGSAPSNPQHGQHQQQGSQNPVRRTSSRTGRVHDVSDGRYNLNRTGHPLCSAFQSGDCKATVNGSWCAADPSKAHQCARCLSVAHGENQCQHKEPPQVNFLKMGKSRGKGKDKGGRKGRAPYWPTTDNEELVSHGSATDLTASQQGDVDGSGVDTAQEGNSLSTSAGRISDHVSNQGTRRRLLYLFSGPERPDSIRHFCSQLGWDVDEIDIEATPPTDLLDCDRWESILSRVESGHYDAGLGSPPCCSFSAARSEVSGPRPLRMAEGDGLFGRKDLTQSEFEDVKVGNILADRTAVCMDWFNSNHKPWIVEQPAPREGQPSMVNLPKFRSLRSSPGVNEHIFSQCKLGQKFRKDTIVLGRVSFEKWPGTCDHPSKEWIIPWNGKKHWGPHPPLRGKQLAIPIEQWDRSMLRRYEPKGEFLTKATAHYPALLNRIIAATIALAPREDLGRTPREKGVKRKSETCQADLPIPKFKVTRTLQKNDTDELIVGGLRRPRMSVGRVPKLFNLGTQLGNLVRKFVRERPELKSRYLGSIGDPGAPHFPGGSSIDPLRIELAKLLCRVGNVDQPNLNDVNQSVSNENCTTSLKANFLELWTTAADDPGKKIVSWLKDGAPGGITYHPELDGLFSKVDKDDHVLEPDVLKTNFQEFHNYEGVEENEQAHLAIRGYIEKGFLNPFSTLDECVRHLNGKQPVLSRLGCIVKDKVNDQGIVTTKTRIILDAKQSSITAATQRTYKSELPRVSDAVHDLLDLMARLRPGEEIRQMVADVVDAFWLIPLHPNERRFFAARLDSTYLIFNRTAQGSRLAPLTFAAIMALCTRLVQSMLQRSRLQVYVDDPWTGLSGSPETIDEEVMTLLVGWELLGLPVAYHKAAIGKDLKWIGMQITVHQDSVEVRIPEDKIKDIDGMARAFLGKNLVPDKELRTFIGKVMNVASVIHAWKPFVMQLYAGLHADKTEKGPHHCTWVNQIRPALLWIIAFLRQQEHSIIRRVWNLQEYLSDGTRIIITWDASPWGFGAVLHVDGQIVDYFHDKPTEQDLKILDVTVGESSSQQAFECLCGLIAMRHWAKAWQNKRCTLTIRSDNIGALVLLGRLDSKSPRNNLIAREAALDMGESTFKPQVAEHIPGISNITADLLSRIYQPGSTAKLPTILAGVPRSQPAVRDRTWWRSLSAPDLPRSMSEWKQWEGSWLRLRGKHGLESCCNPYALS